MRLFTYSISSCLLITMLCLSFVQCKPIEAEVPETTEGYVPIYGNRDSVSKVFAQGAQPIVNTGKIYSLDNLLFQVEVGKGLHIINITDPANPVKEGFIHIMGIEEMAIVDNKLYANNFNDFITVDIADLQNPVVQNRINDAFHLFSSVKPPANGWFECVDPAKGIVIGWKMQTLHRPKCKI